MFSKGQLIFAGVFAIIFAIIMVWSYKKDVKLHQFYYKKVWVVALGIIIAIALFAILTFALHE